MTKSQQISALLTAIFTFLVILLLCLCYLRWPGSREWPPEPQPYIEMAAVEEFIEPVDLTPSPITDPGQQDAPAQTETDLDNDAKVAPETGVIREARGQLAPVTQPVTSQRPSEAKVQPKPKQPVTGANVDNEKKEQQDTDQRTNNLANNIFAQSQAKNNANNKTDDKERAGRRHGRKDSAGPAKSRTSTRGNHIGGGFAWPALKPNIVTDRLGSVTVVFTINPDGSVASAKAISATNTANDTQLKRQCENYVKSLRFPHKGAEKPSEPVTGNRLTFNFDN